MIDTMSTIVWPKLPIPKCAHVPDHSQRHHPVLYCCDADSSMEPTV